MRVLANVLQLAPLNGVPVSIDSFVFIQSESPPPLACIRHHTHTLLSAPTPIKHRTLRHLYVQARFPYIRIDPYPSRYIFNVATKIFGVLLVVEYMLLRDFSPLFPGARAHGLFVASCNATALAGVNAELVHRAFRFDDLPEPQATANNPDRPRRTGRTDQTGPDRITADEAG